MYSYNFAHSNIHVSKTPQTFHKWNPSVRLHSVLIQFAFRIEWTDRRKKVKFNTPFDVASSKRMLSKASVRDAKREAPRPCLKCKNFCFTLYVIAEQAAATWEAFAEVRAQRWNVLHLVITQKLWTPGKRQTLTAVSFHPAQFSKIGNTCHM